MGPIEGLGSRRLKIEVKFARNTGEATGSSPLEVVAHDIGQPGRVRVEGNVIVYTERKKRVEGSTIQPQSAQVTSQPQFEPLVQALLKVEDHVTNLTQRLVSFESFKEIWGKSPFSGLLEARNGDSSKSDHRCYLEVDIWAGKLSCGCNLLNFYPFDIHF